MAVCFFDTSALVKRYAAEIGSAWVQQTTHPKTGNKIYIVSITGVEVVSALKKKVRERLPPLSPSVAFNYVPEFEQAEPAEREPPPVGLEYLEENARALDGYQQDFIREACAQPYSFFVITDVRAGESLGLRDIFLPRTFTVKEAAASKTLRRGDIIFSRIVELEGQAVMIGMAPTALPPRQHHLILDTRDDFKKKLQRGGVKLDQALLLEHDLEMRSLYFEMVELVSNPPLPELRNTDGEPVKFVKLYFKLECSPQEALAGLKSLSLAEFQDGILTDAAFDASGNLTEVTLGW